MWCEQRGVWHQPVLLAGLSAGAFVRAGLAVLVVDPEAPPRPANGALIAELAGYLARPHDEPSAI